MPHHILLLHGALGNGAQLEPLKEKLESEYSVEVLEFEGHGYMNSKPFDMEILRDQVLSKLSKPTLVFGYSMGGYAALKAAAHKPKNLKGIVCYGTKFDWSIDSTQQELKMLNPEMVQEKVPQFAKLLSGRFGATSWQDQMNNTAQMMGKLSLDHQLKETELEAIDIPVHIYRGTMDKMVGRAESLDMAQKIKNAKFLELEACPHPIEKVDSSVLQYTIESLNEVIAE
ncbi:alpha/beta hydrolase [bacterium]|nr:alpha/beta hydrolase [bacterium]